MTAAAKGLWSLFLLIAVVLALAFAVPLFDAGQLALSERYSVPLRIAAVKGGDS